MTNNLSASNGTGQGSLMKILIIEDDEDTRANLQDILEMDQYEVELVGSVQQALHNVDWSTISAALLDWKLPDGTAEDLMPRIRERAPNVDIIVSTGAIGLSGAVTALRNGASDYILKPIDADTLRASLARIAHRQKLQREKARSEAAFRALVEAAPSMIVILRPDATILYFSPFAEHLTGHASEEVLGKDYLDLFLPQGEIEGTLRRKIQQISEGASTRGYENAIRCRDGTQRWIVWNAQLLHDYEGEPAILAIGQDITPLREAQEEKVQAARLAGIGQMMTGIAHESGNALARSQACLEMLEMEVEDNRDAMNLIQRIQNAHNDLQRLYEEVRGYASPVRLEKERWDVRSIWKEAWNRLAVARQNQDAVLVEKETDLDLKCLVDSFRLEQVLRNVLDNALSAGKDPLRIEISCDEIHLDGRAMLRISICDNGPGLTPEQQQKIFDPFFTTKTKGTGLGMAIAKRIIHAHGGDIIAETNPAGGAKVMITLPREEATLE